MNGVGGLWGNKAVTMTGNEAGFRRACLKAELPVTKKMVKEALASGALEVAPLQGGLGIFGVSDGRRTVSVMVFDTSLELSAGDRGTAREVTSAAIALAQLRDAAAEDPWRAAERIGTVMRVFGCIEEAGVEVPRQAWPEVPPGMETAAAEIAAAVKEAEEALVATARGARGDERSPRAEGIGEPNR